MSIGTQVELVADKVYEKGREDEWSAFWDAFQTNGTRTNYGGTFSGEYWTDGNFKPKHKIVPTNADSMFRESAITNGELLRGKLDLSKNTNGYCSFYWAKFTTLPHINCSNLTDLYWFFGDTRELTKIELITLNNEGTTKFTNTFNYDIKLSYIRFEGVIGKTIDFKVCPLDKESIKSVINHLSKSASGQTLSLKKTAVNSAFSIDVDDEATYTDEWNTLINSVSNWTINFI